MEAKVQSPVSVSTPGRVRMIMVDADATGDGEPRMRFAARLAARFGAAVVGMKAADFHSFYPIEDVGFALEQLIAAERAEIEKGMAASRVALERIAGEAKVGFQWREAITTPTNAFIRQSREADLIVAPSLRGDTRDIHRRPNVGSLVMEAGRPVFVLPPNLERPQFRRVVVAWKDTRESRRALVDSLPFLHLAESVLLVTACDEADKPSAHGALSEVRAYLSHHSIKAQLSVASGDAEDVVLELSRSHDLIVAGGYGHSRLREWVFGGVTDNLLHEAECCVLFSH